MHAFSSWFCHELVGGSLVSFLVSFAHAVLLSRKLIVLLFIFVFILCIGFANVWGL
jgi:hypothetical protein